MRTRFYTLLAAASLILAGCTKDETTTERWNGEIRLASGIEVQQTRAMYGHDTQIAYAREVYFWVDDCKTGTNLYDTHTLIADGNGGFVSYADGPMYYPKTGANVDIYAIHYRKMAPSGEGLLSEYPIEVNDLQQIADQYISNDLLYAVKKNQQRQSAAVPLTFYHLLSKVEVALKAGFGLADLSTVIRVSIVNTKLGGTFKPNKDVDMTDRAARAAMITVRENSTPGTIDIAHIITDDFAVDTEYAECIVMPQTVAKGSSFIRVELKGGAVLTYKIPDTGDGLVLESGKKYRFNITVNLSSISVSSNVSDWEAETTVNGDAVME